MAVARRERFEARRPHQALGHLTPSEFSLKAKEFDESRKPTTSRELALNPVRRTQAVQEAILPGITRSEKPSSGQYVRRLDRGAHLARDEPAQTESRTLRMQVREPLEVRDAALAVEGFEERLAHLGRHAVPCAPLASRAGGARVCYRSQAASN